MPMPIPHTFMGNTSAPHGRMMQVVGGLPAGEGTVPVKICFCKLLGHPHGGSDGLQGLGARMQVAWQVSSHPWPRKPHAYMYLYATAHDLVRCRRLYWARWALIT